MTAQSTQTVATPAKAGQADAPQHGAEITATPLTSSRPSSGSPWRRAMDRTKSAPASGCRLRWCVSGCGWARRRRS